LIQSYCALGIYSLFLINAHSLKVTGGKVLLCATPLSTARVRWHDLAEPNPKRLVKTTPACVESLRIDGVHPHHHLLPTIIASIRADPDSRLDALLFLRSQSSHQLVSPLEECNIIRISDSAILYSWRIQAREDKASCL